MTLNTLLIYFGTVVLVLIFQYGFKNYAITLIAGFIAFCVFYFSFGIKDFQWQINFILNLFKNSAIIYLISFAIGIIIYKLLPLKQNKEIAA